MIFKHIRITLSVWDDYEEVYELCTLEQAMEKFKYFYSELLDEDVEISIICTV